MTEIDVVLPRPHPSQQLVLQSKSRFIVLLCGRRWGKSQIAQIISINKMLNGEKIAYITPTFDLSKNFYGEIIRALPQEIISSSNKSDLTLELITGGSLKFFSGESLERFRGYKFHYIIVDEAAFIPNLEEEWYASIRPTLSDYQGGGMFISTPNGKEFHFSLYLKGKNGLDPDYQSFHFASNDNPYFPKEEFEKARLSLPSFRFNQEYLAIPGESRNNPFGTDNINKNITPTLSTEPTVVFGIDVAKYNDWSVIVGLDKDGNVSHFEKFQQPWMSTMDRIKNLPQGILKVIDSTGVGDVLLEQLYQATNNIIGFKFTTESKPKIMYELVKSVEEGRLKYPESIAEEMYVFEYKYTSTGHIKFEAKSGYHDDSICALALANHHLNQTLLYSEWKLHII